MFISYEYTYLMSLRPVMYGYVDIGMHVTHMQPIAFEVS